MSDVQASPQQFNLARIYMKDASVEMPQGGKTFLANGAPDAHINMSLSVNQLENNVWETAVRITVQASVAQSNLYLIEVEYAALSEIVGFSEEEQQHILNVDVPSMIMPYITEYVSSALSRMTLPILYVPTINFYQVYQNKLAEAAAAA